MTAILSPSKGTTMSDNKNLSLNIWSLFSGIGGLEKGLEDANLGHTHLQCESDLFCQSVLSKHWPYPKSGDTPKDSDPILVSDVKNIKWSPSYDRWTWGYPDLICGGFPCQPHSLAGKRKGAEDDRHLWPEFARIIDEFNPRYVIAENVPGIRTNGALREVLCDLDSLGFDAEWVRLGAAAVGAPHLRERIFIVAYPGSKRRQQIAASAHSNESQNGRGTQKDHKPASDGQSDSARIDSRPQPKIFTDAQRLKLPIDPTDTGWETEPNVGRVANGIPKRVDRLKALGNAVVPQVAEFIGSCLYDAISEGRV